jgi:hypothetical protein
VDPEGVAHLRVLMFRDLLERRLFDGARLFNSRSSGPKALFPLLHEAMDMHNPQTEKED